MWRRNRFLSLSLAAIGLTFWMCLRDLSDKCVEYPLLSLVYDARFQFVAFLGIGFALAWTFLAWRPGARRGMWLGSLGMGAGFLLYQAAYNRAFARWGVFYSVNPWIQLAGIFAGTAACALLARGGEFASGGGQQLSLQCISAHRSQLMGVGMLAVVLVHTRSMDVRYIFPLNAIVRLGNMGVDIFLFVSGIGMVYSLSGDPGIWRFYKRRIRRIYPEAMPWIAAYSLVCLCIGRFSVPDAIVTSLGVGGLIGGGGFNWYIPYLLLFYAMAPFLYRLLRRERTRAIWALVLLISGLGAMLLVNDVLRKESQLIGLSRFPVFLVGMLAGFWLKEARGPSRAEYRSMLPLAALLLVAAYLLSAMELQSIVGSMWLCYCIAAPVLCLMLSRAFDRMKGEGWLLRFLRWSGENSLLIYVWNILLVRLYSLFSVRYLAGRGNLAHCLYAGCSMMANYLIVYLIQRAKAALRRTKGA